MTVTIPSQDAIEPSPEEKREHVIAYLSRRHGTKHAYLTEHGLSSKAIHRWKRALADGNLEQGLIPRQTGTMTTDDIREIVKLRAQIEQLKTHLTDAQDQAESAQRQLRDNQLSSAADIDRICGDYQHQLAHSKKQQEELRQAIDALGKAIALMHRDGTS